MTSLGVDLNRPFYFAGRLWKIREVKTFNHYGHLVSAQLDLNYIPPKETAMTEAWTGRKYRGAYTGTEYQIISEPISHAGAAFVGYVLPGGKCPGLEKVNNFEKTASYVRIIEPKFAVGDKVKDYSGDIFEIEAVGSKPDSDGDRAYLAVGADGVSIPVFENYVTKVSQ
jgi:hypothetical protein